jgi:hypothetical protein
MNPDAKLVAAAQRAARKLSRAEGASYQSCLDRVARQAGRRNWGDFLAGPTAVDGTADAAAAEPDFAAISRDGHLDAVVEHGVSIGGRAVLARACTGQGTRLVYCSARSDEYDHPIDARGLSVEAMIACIATASRDEDGRAVVQDAVLSFGIDDAGDGSQLRMSLDRNPPPPAPAADTPDEEERQDRRRLGLRTAAEDAVAGTTPLPAGLDDRQVLDLLVELAWSASRADAVAEPRERTFDVTLAAGGASRLVHSGGLPGLHMLIAMAKDRGRMDQMEMRVAQYGEWAQEIDGERVGVHVATEPAGASGSERLRIGFTPFVQRAIARPFSHAAPHGGRMPIGEHGLLRPAVQHADEDDLLVVSGAPGSGRTGRFVVPVAKAAHGVDVVASDLSGGLVERLGDAWTRHPSTILLDPRRVGGTRAPAFNPLHPDMMPGGHVEAAEWISATLVPGPDQVSAMARDALVGIVDLLVAVPSLRNGAGDTEGPASIPMALDWAERHLAAVDRAANDLEGTPGRHALLHLGRLAGRPADERRAVRDRLVEALAFARDDGARSLLAPENEDRGAALATALMLRRQPSLVVVGGDPARGHGRIAALAMQAAVHLRRDLALRRTHLLVDDAAAVGPMPWLADALRAACRMPPGTAAAVVLDGPDQIDALAPGLPEGRAQGVARWLVEEIHVPGDRRRVAQAMGLRTSSVPAHRPDGRRVEVTPRGVRLLRR